MKRMISLLLAALAVVTLAACGSKSSATVDAAGLADALVQKVEKLKASVRAKVEHPFRVIKRQFGHVKVRYRGLAKNTAQLKTLFALSNLWMVRRALAASMG